MGFRLQHALWLMIASGIIRPAFCCRTEEVAGGIGKQADRPGCTIGAIRLVAEADQRHHIGGVRLARRRHGESRDERCLEIIPDGPHDHFRSSLAFSIYRGEGIRSQDNQGTRLRAGGAGDEVAANRPEVP